MKSLKEDGFSEIMEMFASNDEEPIPLDKEFKVGDYYVRDGWDNFRRIYKIVDNVLFYQPINEDTKHARRQNNKDE